ncbi:MAG: type IV secretion system protein VirB10, partial [Cyanobacteria bacterium REEB65]|nr:type IV secretion system protein VirB10 [Cyanobacteria bacterium REEB65]
GFGGAAASKNAPSTGPVASQLTSSATPVARATRMVNRSLILPKGRQLDCILTRRIISELPGLTSCVVSSNLYGADGKVLLIERGTEVEGEYGSSGQAGLRRLFVVWTRLRTPTGVEVDLQSPGTDQLGVSGLPGYLEQRWGARIGAALLLSSMKDVVELAVARQQAKSGAVVVQPGQNTIQTGQDLAEQVLKQTINIKPTLYLNEGDRIAIYAARDLDFSSVYALKRVAVASPGAAHE